MKTIDERLDLIRTQLTEQDAAWAHAKASLARLGGAPIRVPVAALAAIDAVARRAHAAAGALSA
jgi:hypothetical protein